MKYRHAAMLVIVGMIIVNDILLV